MRTVRLAAALALALASPAGAAEGPGTTALPVLQVPLTARAAGMGTAFAAVATDSSALFYNPAGLARLNAHELGFSFVSGVGETTMQNFAYGGPTPLTGVSGNGYTSVGASLLYSRSGTIEVNRLRADGSLGSSESLNAGQDLILSGAYAERVGYNSFELKDGSYQVDHYLGLGGKYARSTLVQTYTASAFAADIGYLAHCQEARTSFGASVMNLGGKLRYSQEADPLPTIGRAGVAWHGGTPSVHNFIVAGDVEYLLQEKSLRGNAGLEYFWVKTYGARLGYQFNRDEAGLTTGFGLRWKGRVLFDYAWGLTRALTDSHRVTVTYRFGGVAPSQRARQRRPFIDSVPERDQLRGIEERQPQFVDPPARPRPVPRERPQGVPGWIY
jgi:hypothetical protein